jgi:hypothetical protein
MKRNKKSSARSWFQNLKLKAKKALRNAGPERMTHNADRMFAQLSEILAEVDSSLELDWRHAAKHFAVTYKGQRTSICRYHPNPSPRLGPPPYISVRVPESNLKDWIHKFKRAGVAACKWQPDKTVKHKRLRVDISPEKLAKQREVFVKLLREAFKFRNKR